jgi:Fe-S-cluster containining protein
MIPSDFKRTVCACEECTRCCLRQPGPLAPNDFERIAAFLGEDRETAKEHFWASPGAIVQLHSGETVRVGTITPRYRKGRCVFLDENNRCKIHPVAPFGCAYFDTHMSNAAAQARGSWLAHEQMTDAEYKKLRSELPYATHHKPLKYSLGGSK